ncbi:hypothetical protein CLHUN_40310 [Ruminiclostridium hungatei]|uniref:Uncharacterized protein n=1 Tax=Ruminiclostridium hungatei TaxID=48256 RepID=A0A1V4SF83_RUMHU|nr:hypothetical protein [Ruminiclostridium hungatei]OPX42125.1 hypothetical protein CLHUN_40310 [Ruminiclostridium hungatei]
MYSRYNKKDIVFGRDVFDSSRNYLVGIKPDSQGSEFAGAIEKNEPAALSQCFRQYLWFINKQVFAREVYR